MIYNSNQNTQFGMMYYMTISVPFPIMYNTHLEKVEKIFTNVLCAG